MPMQLDLRTICLKHPQLNGSSQGTRDAFRRVLHYIENVDVRTLLERTWKLPDFRAAQQAFIDKNHIGNLVIVPDAKWGQFGAPHGQ